MSDGDVTSLLKAVCAGNHQAMDDLIGVIYPELKRIAAALMRKESAGHTLQPTALVNEAYLRLVSGDPSWENRAHFFGAAARSMRRILVDHARAKGAQKRGGDAKRATFQDLKIPSEDNQIEILALDQALNALEEVDPRLLKVVELRYFTGLSIEQTATLLGISEATVKRDWTFARAWLYDYMNSPKDQVDTLKS